MNPQKYELHKDRFTKARGGSSEFLIICCAQCQHEVLLYQKDGPGRLLRMYLDKIHAPENLTSLAQETSSKSDLSGLHCPQHQELLAVPMLYKTENRLALRIIPGTIHSKKSKGWFPSLDEENTGKGD